MSIGISLNYWKDILWPHLPSGIYEVELYDRYIRNRYQFKSEDIKHIIQIDLKNIRDKFSSKNIKISYEILDQTKEMPHYRRVKIESGDGKYSIWLDRGLDIFKFDDLETTIFSTLDTYVVLERTD